MKNYDQSVEINCNPNSPYTPYHPYRILIFGGSGSGKTNVLLSLVRLDIGNVYLYVKNPLKSKYQLLINGTEIVGIKKIKNSKELIGYSQTIDDVYKNLELYNPRKKRKKLIVLMI